jgi:hypothetical protein
VTINFGVLPVRSSFTLSSDADFFQVVRTADGSNFPASTTMQLKFLSAADAVLATWTAAVVTDTATFHEDKAVVAALLGLLPVASRLYYVGGVGAPELLLAQGLIHDVSP